MVASTFPGGSLGERKAERRWSWPQWIALLALPILVWEAWTIIAWLSDGPRQITEFRDHDSASWYMARALEALAIAVALIVLVYVVRGCRRERRFLTFDVMFLLCGFTLFWGDVLPNFFVPMFLVTSNFVNVNNAVGHMPFVVNPDAGRAPDPILFSLLFNSFGILGFAIVFGQAVNWARNRWPALSNRQIFGLVLLTGFVIDGIFEIAVMVPLHMWTYAAPEVLTLNWGGGARFPLVEVVFGGALFGILMSIRIFKDDRGRSIVERGLDGYRPGRRRAISFLALYGVFQFALLPGNGVVILTPYVTVHRAPHDLINNVCDAPGINGTRYGPCPGTPGFRMPGRSTHLPGPRP